MFYQYILVTDLLHSVAVPFKWHIVQLFHAHFISSEHSVNCSD